MYELDVGGRVAGYCGLTSEPPAMIVDKLYVAPALIGTGRGKLLWQHAVATAQNFGACVLTFAADPNAAPFYRAMGADWVEAISTSRPNWDLQMFRFPVPAIDVVGQ